MPIIRKGKAAGVTALVSALLMPSVSCSDGEAPVVVASIDLDHSSDTIIVGETAQLIATVKDGSGKVLTGRAVSWSSGNTAAATVSQSGLVTGASPGSAFITASSEGKSANAEITVIPVPVATVDVTRAGPSSLFVGSSIQLLASVKDHSGNILIDRTVQWFSANTAVASVSSTGVVTGVSAGAVDITASSEDKSGTLQVVVNNDPVRSMADRADDVTGPQIHVMYVIPNDGNDRQLDMDGTLERSVASFHNWFIQRSNGLAFRFDTFQDALDITFFRLARSNAQMIAYGALVVTEIERELRNAGQIAANKIYIVYYDGGSTFACGGAAWPPNVPGQVAAMYLQGTPGSAQCGAQNFVTSPTQFPRYWEFAMLHDMVHTLGIVATNAPNHADAYPAHVPDRNDLMYSGPLSWIIDASTTIDVGGDDYFGINVPPAVTRLRDSPFVTTVSPMMYPRMQPLSFRAARDLADAFVKLPPHAPFVVGR